MVAFRKPGAPTLPPLLHLGYKRPGVWIGTKLSTYGPAGVRGTGLDTPWLASRLYTHAPAAPAALFR